MKRTKVVSSLNVMTVLIILLGLLLAFVGVTNSWFTSGQGLQIECIVNIGQMNLSLYQVNSDGEDVLIRTFNENETSNQPSYVDVTNGEGTKEIVPDVENSLTLKLVNNDQGDQSVYLRYKIEFYVSDYNSNDILLNSTIAGYTAPTASNNGFVYSNGYYYYQNNAGENQIFPYGEEINLMTSFVIDYSSFAFDGEYPTISGNNFKIVITVEGFDVDPGV